MPRGTEPGWKRRFEDPIDLREGRQLVTLEEAAAFIMKLKKVERERQDWQLAGAILIGAAEGREPLMHARIGMLRAINAGQPAPVPEPRRKAVKAYRIVR